MTLEETLLSMVRHEKWGDMERVNLSLAYHVPVGGCCMTALPLKEKLGVIFSIPRSSPPRTVAEWIVPKVETGDVYYGVDRSVDPHRLSGSKVTSGEGCILDEDICTALAINYREGGNSTHVFVSTKRAECEYSIQGPLGPVKVIPCDMDDSVMYALQPDTWWCLDDESGSTLICDAPGFNTVLTWN